MGYIKKTLGTKEKVLLVGGVHWFIYFPGFICMIITLMALSINQLFAMAFTLFGAYLIIRAYFTQTSTELVLTDERLVGKTGLFKKEILDMKYNEIFKIRIEQPITGKLLNFGTIKLYNKNNKSLYLEYISDPVKFRNTCLVTIEKVK